MTTLFDLVMVLMDWILGLCGRRKTREREREMEEEEQRKYGRGGGEVGG